MPRKERLVRPTLTDRLPTLAEMRALRERDYRSPVGAWEVDEPIGKLLERYPRRGSSTADPYWSLRHLLMGTARVAATSAVAAYADRLTRDKTQQALIDLDELLSSLEHYLTEQRSHVEMLLRNGLPKRAVGRLVEARAIRRGDALLAVLREHHQSLSAAHEPGDATDHLGRHFVEVMHEFWVWWTLNDPTSDLFFQLMAAVARDAGLWPDKRGPNDDLQGWLERKYRSTIRPSQSRGQSAKR